ncbi:MAG: hypothetical protein K6T16_01750 [Candidatus Pacearchaeota archaeon]|nr:hypothetical protein [Candidatus Pacearchaeota archaeon]
MESDEAKGKTKTAEQIIKEADSDSSDPAPRRVTRPNWRRIGIAIFIVALIALAVILILIFTKHVPVAKQEMLNITYKIESENGSLIDSGTRTFAVGKVASGIGLKTNKLDKEIEDMTVGEEKTIGLEAEDAYGKYDEGLVYYYNRTERINRTNEINRTDTITTDEFTEVFGEQPMKGKVYEIPGAPFKYKVTEVTETKVKISIEARVGNELSSGGFFPAKVIEVTDDKIVIKLIGNNSIVPTQNGNLEINFTDTEIIFMLSPEIGQEVQLGNNPRGKVTALNATHITVDANPALAGQKVKVKITLNNKFTEKVTGEAIKHIPGAPTLQVFIMSYCPYGVQAVKGVLPVWGKFQDKANIELRFVSYTMHGAKEEEENNRMICIREEQSSKLLPYLKCFVEAGDSSGCIKKAGVDESKLTSCMASRASQYMEEDKTLNKKYGVQGSPTFILDGKEASIYPRDPQSIATAICNAFTGSKPSVCSESFSTENPSPGFGWGSSSSSSGGSCG